MSALHLGFARVAPAASTPSGLGRAVSWRRLPISCSLALVFWVMPLLPSLRTWAQTPTDRVPVSKRDAMLATLDKIIASSVARKDTAHPVFHGCYDWHSAVHGHWAILRLARVTDGQSERAQVIVDALTPDGIKLEAEALRKDSKFEMPYGRAWFLRLAIEYELWAVAEDQPDVGRLRSMADALAASLVEYYRDRVPSPETREYANDAWALVQLHEYLTHRQQRELRVPVETLISTHFLRGGTTMSFTQDHKSPDFFSRFGNWAYLIAKTQEVAVVEDFLRQHPLADDDLRPVDPLLRPAHHLGVNWSRVWALRALARKCGDENQRERLDAASRRHIETAWKHHQAHVGNYDSYDHWVPQFAVYALTE